MRYIHNMKKITLSAKFKKFLYTIAPMFIIVGLAIGTLFSVTGGISEYSPKTISEITQERYGRVTDVESVLNPSALNLKKLKNKKYKRTRVQSTTASQVYYMMEDSHLLFVYTVYNDGHISITIEGEEKYYSIVES